MAYYKILSLDGGGTWAMIQVQALLNIYGDVTGREVLRKFDLVAANSGGSIVLGALCEDWKLSRIDALFKDKAQRETVFVKKFFRGVARYSTREKLKGLQKLLPFGATHRINEVVQEIRKSPGGRATDLLITSFDYDRKRAVYFRSNLNSRTSSGSGYEVRLAEAIHASTNAPIKYFDEPAEVECFSGTTSTKRRFWDGGVAGLNNPVLAAVTEALANDPARRADVRVLSIGTANVFRPMAMPDPVEPLGEPVVESTLYRDMQVMATSVLDDPPDVASYVAHVMLGGPIPQPGASSVDPQSDGLDSPVVRMNPMIQPWYRGVDPAGKDRWELPDGWNPGAFRKLVKLDMDAVDQPEVDLISAYINTWLADRVPNQPVQAGHKLSTRIGARTFNSAKQRWAVIEAAG